VSSAPSDSDTDDEHEHQSEIDSIVDGVDSPWEDSSTDEGDDSDTDEDNGAAAVDPTMSQPGVAVAGRTKTRSQSITTTADEIQVSEAITQSLSPTLELSREYRSLTFSGQHDTIRRRRVPTGSASRTSSIVSVPNSIQLTFPDPLTASDPIRTLSAEPTLIEETNEPSRESSFASTVPDSNGTTISLPASLSSIDYSSAVLSLAPSSATPLRHALQIIILGSSSSTQYLKDHLMKYILRCATRAVRPGGVFKEVLTQETLCARSRAYAMEHPGEDNGNEADPRTSVLVLDCTGRPLEIPDMVRNLFLRV
jgi:hypothetical protein